MLAIATEAAFIASMERGSCQVCGRGWANSTNIKKMHKQARKDFGQMGMSSIQA